MEIKKLSASSYSRWSGCEMAYFIENNLNYRFPGGLAANVGSCAHSILETLAKIKLAQQNKEELIKTEIGEVNSNNFNVSSIIDKTYDLYSNKESLKHLDWKPENLTDIRKYILTVMTQNKGMYNPLNRKIVSTEQYIKLEIKEDWSVLPDGTNFSITGFIDLVTDEGNDTFEITDYKTGSLTDFHTGQKITAKSLNDNIQVRMYHYALSNMYGCEKNYLITMYFLKFASPITISLSCNDLDKTLNMLKDRFLKIKNTKIPKLSRSFKCRRFCDYGKNAFQHPTLVTPTQFIDNQVSNVGDPMCYCDYTNYEINRRGMDWVNENMKLPK